MGKALVIKNANFAANKLTTVTLDDPKPCTGIVLSDSTKTMTAIGSTFTLTATLTPADTTDAVTWSTSDATKATVSNGVVTQTGVGSATITATCGNQTATCAVTAANVLSFSHTLGTIATQRPDTSGGDVRDYGYATNENEHYCSLYNDSNPTTYRVEKSTSLIESQNLYPIPLGPGATTVTANVPENVRITVWFIDKDTACEYGQINPSAANFAKVISGDVNAFDSNVPVGPRVMTVPEGANSAIFSLQKPGTGNSVTEEDVAAVTITVS